MCIISFFQITHITQYNIWRSTFKFERDIWEAKNRNCQELSRAGRELIDGGGFQLLDTLKVRDSLVLVGHSWYAISGSYRNNGWWLITVQFIWSSPWVGTSRYLSLTREDVEKPVLQCLRSTILTRLKPWPNELASRRKFAMGGQTDSPTSRLASSRKSQKVVISRIYSSLAINLCWLALGGQTMKNPHQLAYKINASHRTSPQSCHASGWPNENASRTQVKNLRVRLAKAPVRHIV